MAVGPDERYRRRDVGPQFGRSGDVRVQSSRSAHVLGKLAHAQGPQPEEQTVLTRLEGFVRRHIEFLRDHRALYLRVVREEEFGEVGVESALRQARAAGERQVAGLAELADPLPALVGAAISGWTGFLDRTAEAFFESPDVELDALVALIVDAFEAVVESASRRSDRSE